MDIVHSTSPPGGWYADPAGRAAYRFWSGESWTQWVSDGTTVAVDLRPVRGRLGREDLAHLGFIETVFIPEARAAGVLTPTVETELAQLRLRLEAEARHQTAPAAAPAGAPGPGARVPSTPAVASDASSLTPESEIVAPVLEPAPAWTSRRREPSSRRGLWTSTREALATDLATHGLAYLGVLLVFIGSFGLVVFAFADVARSLRPMAELVIATVPFAAGALLRKRGAVVAGRALEVAGGLLLPVMVITSFLDGFAVPPELNGVPLVLALTGSCACVALGYARWSSKRPESGLRFMVAPATWFTAAMASLGLGRGIPAGNEVSVPGAEQMVAVAAVLVLTLVVAVLRPRWALSSPTLTAGIAGSAVIGLLSLLAWGAEDWPALPAAATGALLLAALELSRARLSAAVVGAAETVWVTVVGLALVPGFGLAEAAALTTAVLVLVVERAAERKAPAWAVAVPAALGVGAMLCTYAEPWWAVGTFSVATAWAVARRVRPYAIPAARPALDVAAAALPSGLVVAMALATDLGTATAMGAGLVLVATLPATRPVLHRDAQDAARWRSWWCAAAASVALVAIPGAVAAGTPGQRWWMVTALATLVLGLVRGPVPWVWRVWVLMSVVAWTWWSTALLLELSPVLRGSVLGALGLILVLVAHSERARIGAVGRFSTGGAGHVLTVCALATGGAAWGVPAVLGLATAGFAVSAAFDTVGRSPVVDGAMGVVGEAGRFLAPTLAAMGLPITVMTALDASGVLAFDEDWMMAVPALTALAYAATARVLVAAPARLTACWAAFGWGVVAALFVTAPLASAATASALILAVLLLPRADRVPVMTWTAWATVALLAEGLLSAGFDGFELLDPTEAWSTVLVAVGGSMLLLGTAADVRDRGWTVRLLPARAMLLPVVVIGAAEVAAGEVLAVAVPGDAGGWLAVAGAAVALAAAVLTRAGSLLGVSVVLGWLGTVRLALDEVGAHPWISVAVTAALLLAAEGMHRSLADRASWSRWDVPLLVSAVPVAATAFGAAADGDAYSSTFFSLGLMCWMVAARLYRIVPVAAALGVIGTLLMFDGTAGAGVGWVALLLLGYALGCTVMAVVVTRPWKTALQVAGAVLALASWLTAVAWFAWPAQRSFDVTVAGSAAVALLCAVAALTRRLHTSWIWTWGGTSAMVTAATAAVMAVADKNAGSKVALSWYAVIGLTAVAVAAATAATPLATTWLRDLAIGLGLGAVLSCFEVTDSSATVRVAALAAVSVAMGFVEVMAAGSVRHAAWRRAAVELGMAAAVLAVAISLAELPDRGLLVTSLAVAALQAASSGVALRSVALQSAAPVLACASWLVFASEALNANPQWFTLPIGVALLAVVALWRRERRSRSAPVASPEIVAVELVGVAFLVGSSFVQTFTSAVGYAALAAAISLLIAGWGLVTRIRRRLVAGIFLAAVGAVLLVMVPLVRLLPAWQGAWLWVLVVVIGLVALGAASLLESGREMVRSRRRRFADITQGWE